MNSTKPHAIEINDEDLELEAQLMKESLKFYSEEDRKLDASTIWPSLIRNTKDDTLNLNARYMDLRCQHLEALPIFLEKNPDILHLKISNFSFNGRPIKHGKSGEAVECHNDDALLKKIAELKIWSLSMINCNLGNDEVSLLTDNTAIKELNLTSNHINRKGAESIITKMNLAICPDLSYNSDLNKADVEIFFKQWQSQKNEKQSSKLDAKSKWEKPKEEKKVKEMSIKISKTDMMCKHIIENIEHYILYQTPFYFKSRFFGGKNFKTSDGKTVVVPSKMFKQLETIQKARAHELDPKHSAHLWETTLKNIIFQGRRAFRDSESSDQKRKKYYSLFLFKNHADFCTSFNLDKDERVFIRTLK